MWYLFEYTWSPPRLWVRIQPKVPVPDTNVIVRIACLCILWRYWCAGVGRRELGGWGMGDAVASILAITKPQFVVIFQADSSRFLLGMQMGRRLAGGEQEVAGDSLEEVLLPDPSFWLDRGKSGYVLHWNKS